MKIKSFLATLLVAISSIVAFSSCNNDKEETLSLIHILTGIHVSFAKIIFPLVLISAGAAIILSINKQQ